MFRGIIEAVRRLWDAVFRRRKTYQLKHGTLYVNSSCCVFVPRVPTADEVERLKKRKSHDSPDNS